MITSVSKEAFQTESQSSTSARLLKSSSRKAATDAELFAKTSSSQHRFFLHRHCHYQHKSTALSYFKQRGAKNTKLKQSASSPANLSEPLSAAKATSPPPPPDIFSNLFKLFSRKTKVKSRQDVSSLSMQAPVSLKASSACSSASSAASHKRFANLSTSLSRSVHRPVAKYFKPIQVVNSFGTYGVKKRDGTRRMLWGALNKMIYLFLIQKITLERGPIVNCMEGSGNKSGSHSSNSSNSALNNVSFGFTLAGYCPCQIAKVDRGWICLFVYLLFFIFRVIDFALDVYCII